MTEMETPPVNDAAECFPVDGQVQTRDQEFNPEAPRARVLGQEPGGEVEEEEIPERMVKTTRESLKCYLTQEERNEITNQLTAALQEIDQLDQELAAVKKQFASDKESRQGIVKSCTQRLTNGYEMRPVDCEVVYDYQNHSVTMTRTDTGEIVRTRNMTADEIQRPLF
jgi:hypothetical protein